MAQRAKLNSQDLRFSTHEVMSLGPWRLEEVPWKCQYFFLPHNAVFYPTRLYSSKNCQLPVKITTAISFKTYHTASDS